MATALQTHEPTTAPVHGERPPVRESAASRGARASRRRPRVASAITAIVLVSALLPTSVLTAVGPNALGSSRLALPAAYVALAPLCDVYDALSLLTARQHAAVLAWLAVLFVAVRVARRRRHARSTRAVIAEARALLAAGALVLAFYAAGALVARPMAALRLDDRDELALDVHSHTDASHDGRRGFDAEANREWHAAAGFDVAYVTDHREYRGAEAGARGNPAHAGDGTVLLPGIETRGGGEHLNVLGVVALDSVDRGGDLDVAALRRAYARPRGGRPVTLLTAPVHHLDGLPAWLRIDAVEAIDGAPRGLAFTRVHLPGLVAAAGRRGARLAAGSDEHGWGRTAAAWTVVRVPGWRAMTPADLDVAIRAALGDSSRVRIVARTAPPPPFGVAAWIAVPPRVVWHMFAAAEPAERVAWLLWAWVPWWVAVRGRRAATNRTRAAAIGGRRSRRGAAAA